MKIRGSLMFIVMAGILGATTADREIPNDTRSIPYHMRVLGYVNTTFEDIEKFDKELCEKNGGPNTHDAHKQNREQFEVCSRTVIDEMREEARLAEAQSAGHSPPSDLEATILKGYCRKSSKSANCLKNLTDSMKTCLDVDKRESANVIYEVHNSVMSFLCEDDGARMNKFANDDGTACLESKSSELMNCANHTVMKYIQTTISNGAEVGGLGKLHLLVPDVTKCTVLEKFQHCVVEELKSCPKPTTADMANSVFNIVKKVSSCNKFLKSNAPPANIVNVLLITAVMTMSLRSVLAKV